MWRACQPSKRDARVTSAQHWATSPARRTRWLCRGSVTIGALVLLLAATVLGGEAARHTAPFAAADGSPDPDAVAVMERVDLNGSRQEVWLRGADRRPL